MKEKLLKEIEFQKNKLKKLQDIAVKSESDYHEITLLNGIIYGMALSMYCVDIITFNEKMELTDSLKSL